MSKEISEKTDGRLKVRMYAGGQLGSERDTLEITSFGGLDITRASTTTLNPIAPITIALNLPFLFRSSDHVDETLKSTLGDTILDALEPHGLIGLCFYSAGARNFYNSKKPIYSPDDFSGMKIHTPNSTLNISMIKALGAIATPMPTSEVHQALSRGIVDGAENTQSSYANQGHHEAAPYYSLTRHMIAPEILVMSANRWKHVSEDDKTIIRQAAQNSVKYAKKFQKTSPSRITSNKVKINDISSVSDFQFLMKPIWEQFATTPHLEDLLNSAMSIGNKQKPASADQSHH